MIKFRLQIEARSDPSRLGEWNLIPFSALNLNEISTNRAEANIRTRAIQLATEHRRIHNKLEKLFSYIKLLLNLSSNFSRQNNSVII